MTNPWHYFRSGYRRFKRFIAWFPILWKDEDWDSVYLLEIMRFKISRIRKEIEKNKHHVGYEKRVREMKIVEELLARNAWSDFYSKLSEELENKEKLGKCSCPEETWAFEPYNPDPITGESWGSLYVDLSCEFCKNARSRWFKRDDIKQKEDLDFLFLYLRKHYKRWWD